MLDDRIGLVVNAGLRKDPDTLVRWPGTAELRALGPKWLRSKVYTFDAFQDKLERSPNVKVIALLDAHVDGFFDPEPPVELDAWEQRVRRFADAFGHGQFGGQVAAVECLNEWDLQARHGDEEKQCQTAVACAVRAAPILKAAGIQCLLGSVAGDACFDRLRRAREILDAIPGARDLLDGVCFHPYGKSTDVIRGRREVPLPEIVGAVQQAYQEANPLRSPEAAEPNRDRTLPKNLPVWITEFGQAITRTESADDQARYPEEAFALFFGLPRHIVEVACYFCWRDPSDNGFALRDEAESLAEPPKRKAWFKFAEVATHR